LAASHALEGIARLDDVDLADLTRIVHRARRRSDRHAQVVRTRLARPARPRHPPSVGRGAQSDGHLPRRRRLGRPELAPDLVRVPVHERVAELPVAERARVDRDRAGEQVGRLGRGLEQRQALERLPCAVLEQVVPDREPM